MPTAHAHPHAHALGFNLLTITHYQQAQARHPNARPVPPGHRRIELVTDGRGWLTDTPDRLEVTAGALLWHQPGDKTISQSDFAAPYRCLCVILSVKDTAAVVDAPRISWWSDLHEVRAFTREVVVRFVDERFDRQVLAAYVCSRLLYQANAYAHQRLAPDWPQGLRRVMEAIENHFREPLQLEDLAQLAGWSVAYLHEVFKAYVNTSPHQALIERRLRAARERLVSTNQPIKLIAHDCGFANSAAFCRRFRHAAGMTPNAYRRYHDNLLRD